MYAADTVTKNATTTTQRPNGREVLLGDNPPKVTLTESDECVPSCNYGVSSRRTRRAQQNQEVNDKRTEPKSVEQDIAAVEANIARAKSDRQFEAISKEFDKQSMRASELKAEISRVQVDYTVPVEFNQDMVTRANALFGKIEELATEAEDYSTARKPL